MYKKKDKYSLFLDVLSAVFFMVTTFMFLYNFGVFIIDNYLFNSRNKIYNYNYKININKKEELPNIYWIHMDGMPNLSFFKKYYKEDLLEFRQYLDNNNYIYNEDASFFAGYHTMLALNSLFNPNYYDNYFKDYLDDYRECLINKKLTKDTISFDEIIDKRMDNELFKSFTKNNYKTIAISEYNQYTGMFSNYTYDIQSILNNGKINYFKNRYSKKEIVDNIKINHNLTVINNIFGTKLIDKSLIEKDLDNNIKLDNYKVLDNTNYPLLTGIMKSLEDSYAKDKNSNKLYFIDNGLVHLNWNYDENGKYIGINNDLDNFKGTYIYATKVLQELLDYIKSNDQNSVIIVQGDHGIHDVDDDTMMDYFKVDKEELLNIRSSTISLIYVPEKYKNGDENYLNNPLNISRYLINNYVGDNYDYLK